MPTATCFGTKVPSSGCLITTKGHTSNRVRFMVLMKCVFIIRALLYFSECILLVDILKIDVVFSIGGTVIVYR